MNLRLLKFLRFLVLFLLTALCTCVICNVYIVNFVIVCAKKNYSTNYTVDFVENNHLQDLVLSSNTWSSVLFAIPAGLLMQHSGPRSVLTVLSLVSVVATYLSPLAANYGYYYFIVARIFQGFAYAATYSAVTGVGAAWSPLEEMGIFLAIASTCSQIAAVVTMPIAALFCTSSIGWPGAYYFFATLTIIVAFWWFLVYRNNPVKHPFMTMHELTQIRFNKKETSKNVRRDVPWRLLLTHVPVYAIIVGCIGYMWAFLLLIYFGPKYLKEILKMDVRQTGFWIAVPFLAICFGKLFSGIMSDKIVGINNTVKVKIANSISQFGCACFILALAFTKSTTITLACMASGFTLLGFAAAGYFKAIPLVGQTYSSIITGAVQFIGNVVMLVLPFIVSALTPNHSYNEWRTVFYLTAAVLVFSGIVFVIFGKGEPGPWVSRAPEAQYWLTNGDLLVDKDDMIVE